MATAEGIVEEIIFRNEENGYSVLLLAPEKGRSFTAVGIIPFADEGDFLKLEGDWTEHREYGKQFRADRFELVLPDSKAAIEKYLGSGVIRGCGLETAKRLVKRFGTDTLHIMDTEPERITEVSGMGMKKAAMILESYREKRDAQQAMMFLFDAGLSSNMAIRVYTRFGADTVSVTKNNPYRLADEVKGVGFSIADGIARRLGFSLTDERRLMSGIKYVLDEAVSSAGHTYLPKETLLRDSCDILGVSEELCENALLRQVFAGKLVCEETDGSQNVYARSLYETEADTAVRLVRLNMAGDSETNSKTERAIEKFEHESGMQLSSLQKDAVRLAAGSRVTVITGGPGTGKTTLIKCLISIFSKGKIVLCAPTGRAAKRMSEATGMEACTIHRLLEYGGDEGTFQKDEDEPLNAETVIVDEMSMVDVFLMRALLRAVSPGTRLILTGDADQLPSVGAGNVLGDIIASGVIPVVRLTEVFRQSGESAIVMNAHRINRGEMPVMNGKGTDFFIERKAAPEQAAASVCELVRKRLPGFMGFDPVKDIQVMAPMKKGEAGVFALNTALQDMLNPLNGGRQIKRGDTCFRVNDKVMQIKNDYSIEWKRGSVEGQGVYNGDIGYVLALNMEDKALTLQFDDGRIADYTEDMLDEIELAYCMSVHKSQGSEFPCVVLPLTGGPQMLMTRNLLYTAVTRARRLVVITGREDCVRRMVENNHVQARYTSLCKRLKSLCGIMEDA